MLAKEKGTFDSDSLCLNITSATYLLSGLGKFLNPSEPQFICKMAIITVSIF